MNSNFLASTFFFYSTKCVLNFNKSLSTITTTMVWFITWLELELEFWQLPHAAARCKHRDLAGRILNNISISFGFNLDELSSIYMNCKLLFEI